MFDSNFIANPYETYRCLRETAPLHWVDNFHRGAWLVPRYADVSAGLTDARLSSRRSQKLTGALPEKVQDEFDEFNRIFSRWLLFLDAPQHTRLRRFLNQGFTPQVVGWLRPRIERVVNALLDEVTEKGKMDFMADFAHPLPVRVIAEMFGIPLNDQKNFQIWSDAVADFMGSAQPSIETARRAQNSLLALTDYFRRILPERRKNRSDDLISLLIRLEEEGDALTEEELLAQCSLFFIAGHETTRNLLGNGMLALVQNSEQFALLKQNPSLASLAVREFARYDSPVQQVRRAAAEDFTWHGQEIKRGESVILLIGSANRDADKFSEPEKLNISRSEGIGLSFGRGAHFCIGTTLANLEAEIAFIALLERLPNLKMIDDEPEWRNNITFRGLSRLRLAFQARVAGKPANKYEPKIYNPLFEEKQRHILHTN